MHNVSIHFSMQAQESGRKKEKVLTTHSAHFILLLYITWHMNKDHSDNESLIANYLFYQPTHRQGNTYYDLFYTVVNQLEWEIAHCVH